ncbi:MAG TPA: transglycosylase SLT domain-containing protein, partial [Longimicrobiaceae bacterium]|nr:transglycosylase SLT domain-containing protein [Longimicrobiaceae bacterium]
AALQPLTDGSDSAAAEALYLIGRAEHRSGDSDQAQEIFARLAERFPGSATGSEGLFLVADLSHDEGEIERAARGYREVASNFKGTDRAGLSLMRLGGMAFVQEDFEEAAAVWNEYRDTYPQGQRWLQSTYWAGRAYAEMGDTATAREYYRAAAEREPLSYYALRSAQRLGEDFWPIELAPSPAPDPAARAQVEDWVHGMDLLREAGLHEEAEAEADRLIRLVEGNEALAYALAEVLNERGYTLRGIRLGWDLQGSGLPNERLLRIIYPFPYRAMMSAEAAEKGLDPFLVAALTRQESLFKARITSGAGARGLMQIMPETGKALARSVGIEDWDPEILYNPEINAHLGTIYLAEQMETYDGSLPSVFSAYNAGPHRVDDWSVFPEYGREELFTERIPYRETRDYVKILTRNKEIYQGLYGDDGE